MPIRIRQIGLDSCGNPGGGGGGGCGCCSACCGGAFTRSFDNTDLVGGVLSVTHGLGSQYVDVSVYDENDMMIVPDDVVAVSATVVDIYLTSFTVVPTWNVLVISAAGGGGGGIPGGPNTSIQFNDGGAFGGEAVFAYDKVNNRVHLTGSFSQGLQTTVSNDYSHAQGEESEASGVAAHAEGHLTLASNDYAHAEGESTIASGFSSHAEGHESEASGYASHAEGYLTVASNNYSHAEGKETEASGEYSHAEGERTTAIGYASHAEGLLTVSFTDNSHAEGYLTLAASVASHAEGYLTTGSGNFSHAEGYLSTTTGIASHAEGASTTSSGDYSHAEGGGTTSTGDYSHAEGESNQATGRGSHAEGNSVTASGNHSHAEGDSTVASGTTSHAEGDSTVASGISSHAEGGLTTTLNAWAHAEGRETVANGIASHAEGYKTLALSSYSHSEGYLTTGSGLYSHAEGLGARAVGDYSHAGGYYTVAAGDGQTVVGQRNESTETQSVFTIGNGYSIGPVHIESDLLRAYPGTAGAGYVQVTGSVHVYNETSIGTSATLITHGVNKGIRLTDGPSGVTWLINPNGIDPGSNPSDSLVFSYVNYVSYPSIPPNPLSTTSEVQGYIAFVAGNWVQMNFTGQHRCLPVTGSIDEYKSKVGLIVSSTGNYSNPATKEKITINDSTPIIQLSSRKNDKKVLGVISDIEDTSDGKREFGAGNFVSVMKVDVNDSRLFINSLGEGAIWICDINGNFENGDYITTCEVPGYGMKQDDDLLHNYTVAKITCDCDFDLASDLYKCEEFVHEGKTYRRAFVGCTYHCG
jgi:hypothetical protein